MLIGSLFGPGAFGQSIDTSARQNSNAVAVQKNSSASTNPPPSKISIPPNKIEVNAGDPVITVEGACDRTGELSKNSPCKTVVSRRDFEYLVEAINLGGKPISSGTRQNLAKTYAQYLAYEQPAKAAGLDKTEQFTTIMEWLRIRILYDLLKKQIADEYRTPSDAEVHSYYLEHLSDFDRITVKRLLIPRISPKQGSSKQQNTDEREAARAEVAQTMRDRIVKGEDPDSVQKIVYAKLNLGEAPEAEMGKKARTDFLKDESKELFSMKPGDVSQVEEELTSYVVYKIVTRETLPESDVKDQISNEIARAKIQEANQKIADAVKAEYNDKYFGPPVSEPLPMPSASFHP
jgi:hypothetical protein